VLIFVPKYDTMKEPTGDIVLSAKEVIL